MERPLPRVLWALSLLVLIVGSVMALVGAWTTSASIDETYHVQRMQHYLDDGWFLVDRQLVGGEPAEGISDRFVYGPVTMCILHGLSMLWGVDESGVVSASADAYAVRHVGIALIGLIGVAAAICLGRLVLSSWRWGVLVGAVLVSTPLWTGHLMMNPKDVSVATGYTVFTLGLMILTVWDRPTWRQRLFGPSLIAGGIVLAMGTRPGIWAGIAASLVTFVVIQGVVDLRADSNGHRWVRYLDVGLGVTAAGLALAAIYPAIFTNSVTTMVRSTSASAKYDGATAGAWWYIPMAVSMSVPILVIIVSLIGAMTAFRAVARSRTRPTRSTTRLALILVQAFTLPLVAMLVEAKLYNGVRHFLFVMPVIAVLTAIGVTALLSAEAKRPRVQTAVVSVVVVVGVLAPSVDQLRLFPYNYTYYNEAAALIGIQGQSDWWWTGARELTSGLPPDQYVACIRDLDANGVAHPQWFDTQTDCATSQAGTLAPYASERAGTLESPLSEIEFLAVRTEDVGEADNCHLLYDVTRPVRWSDVVMGRIDRCELRPPKYDAPIDLPAEPNEVGLLDGWLLPTSGESGIVLESARGRVAITVSSAWHGKAVGVTLDATGAGALSELRVNGVEQAWDAADDGEGIAFEVSPEVAAEFGDGRLVFSFFRSTGEGEDHLRLTSLQLSPGRGLEARP